MRWIGVGKTDLGRKRSNNEDSIHVEDALGLYIVCDGMGGHSSGEVASSTAVATASKLLRDKSEVLESIRAGEESFDVGIELATQAVTTACAEIHRKAAEPENEGMGTTMTMLLMLGPKAVLAHVGDSRMYLLRKGNIHLLTTDHTGVGELVKSGAMTEEQAARTPFANVLTRAVGLEESVDVDHLLFDVLPGDRFMICSDGLTAYMSNKDELKLQLSGEFEEIPQTLVQIANESGGRDNVSAVLVRVEALEGEETETRSSDFERQLNVFATAFGYENLGLRTLQRLLNLATLRALDPDEVLIKEGEETSSLYGVVDGRLAMLKGDEVVGELAQSQSAGRRMLLSPLGVRIDPEGDRADARVAARPRALLEAASAPALGGRQPLWSRRLEGAPRRG